MIPIKRGVIELACGIDPVGQCRAVPGDQLIFKFARVLLVEIFGKDDDLLRSRAPGSDELVPLGVAVDRPCRLALADIKGHPPGP